MKKIPKILSVFLAGAVLNSAATQQQDEYHIKPLQVASDVNSVDLLSGTYRPQLPVLSIPAAPNLSLQTLQKLDSKIIGTLYSSTQGGGIGFTERRETYSLTYGASTSEYFECLSYECAPADNTGSTLRGNMNTKNFTYIQGKTGVAVTYNSLSSWFDYTSSGFSDKSYEGTWYATKIVFPDGERHNITYDKTTYGVVTYHRPTKVTSTLGYELHISYQSNNITTGAFGWE